MCAFGTKIRQIYCRGFVLSDCVERDKKNLKKWIFVRKPMRIWSIFLPQRKPQSQVVLIEKKAAMPRCKPTMPVFSPKSQLLAFFCYSFAFQCHDIKLHSSYTLKPMLGKESKIKEIDAAIGIREWCHIALWIPVG